MYWGFSEYFNLHNLYKKYIETEHDEINILLYGACDPRHIIKTISETYNSTVKLNFYVADGVIEIIARNIILLTIAFEQEDQISLLGKTHLFMDIYGNTLLRSFSHNYICSKARHLIKLITDPNYCLKYCPIFDFEHLRYRERDQLENIFHFWMNKKENIFDIAKYWNLRLRAALKDRYDHRKGAFDWDLMMKLRDNGAQQICAQEYTHWRETGVAFTFPEFEYNFPNKTIAAGLVRNGEKYMHRGYCGDAAIGPYATFGLNCEDSKLKASQHGTNQYRATDLTFQNLLEIFYETNNKEKYTQGKDSLPAYGAVVLDNGKSYLNNDYIDVELQNYNQPLLPMNNVSIKFISIEDITKMDGNRNFDKLFDMVFAGSNYFPLIKKQKITNILKKAALLIFETRQITLMKKEDIAEFLNEIKTFCTGCNFETLTKFNINRPYTYTVFKHNETNSM